MGARLTLQSFFITILQIVHGLPIMPAFVGRLPTDTVHVGSFSKCGLCTPISLQTIPKRRLRNNLPLNRLIAIVIMTSTGSNRFFQKGSSPASRCLRTK